MHLSKYPDQWNDSQPINLFAGDLFSFYIKLDGKKTEKVALDIVFPTEIEYKKTSIIIDSSESVIPPNEISIATAQSDQEKKPPVTAHIEADGESIIKISAIAIKHFFWGNKTTELVKIQCEEKTTDATQGNIKEMPVLITPVKIQLYWQSMIDIFGYSLIGIISYCFGLVLNWYNISKDVYSFATLIHPEQSVLYSVVTSAHFSNTLIFILGFQLIFICLFSHSYAKAYLLQNQQAYKDEVKLSVYMTIGKWAEIIGVVLCAIAVFAVFALGKSAVALRVAFLNGIVFWLSTVRYRLGRTMPEDERYVLICPAILMIGLNVFLGASIDMLLNEKYLCLLGLAAFACFFLVMYSAGKKESVKVAYWIFSCVLLLIGGISYLTSNIIVKISFLNVFLGVVMSVYMSIFESWYIPFRQLAGKEKPNEKPYVYLVDRLLFLFPIIVAALYPFQQFKSIYLISSFAGSLAAIFLWNKLVYPSIGKQISAAKRAAIPLVRATLGLATLLFLIHDKITGWEFTPAPEISIAGVVGVVLAGAYKLFISGPGKIREVREKGAQFKQYIHWVFHKENLTHSEGYLVEFFIHQCGFLAAVLFVLGFLYLAGIAPNKGKILEVIVVLAIYFGLLVVINLAVPDKTPQSNNKLEGPSEEN